MGRERDCKKLITFVVVKPRSLFQGATFSCISNIGHIWDLSPDGKRFLMMKETETTASTRVGPQKINIVLKWFEELKQRVPVK